MKHLRAGHQIHAEAVGCGTFPLDMLRYDQCWPLAPGDSYMITESGVRTIRLGKVLDCTMDPRSVATRRWTADRWQSFGWTLFVEPAS